jgi:hypothetical protein
MKGRVRFTVWLLLVWLAFPAGIGLAADKFDLLMQKLVERGVLSQEDASQIEKEIEQETAQQKTAAKETVATEDAVVPTEEGYIKVPKWVQNTKLKGDLRLRYQYDDRDGDGRDERNRGRFRLRLGAETAVTDEVTVGFGFASGGDDPRSTNQTFDDTFSSKNFRIDYAYAQYNPKFLPGSEFVGGKFKNPLWTPKDLLWDGDVNPEGVAGVFDFALGDTFDLYFTPGFFILDEYSDTDADPFMAVFQLGTKVTFANTFDAQIAGTYYYFNNVQGNFFDQGSGTNTLVLQQDGEEGLAYGYDSIGLGAQVGMGLPVDFMPYAAVFGEYIVNIDSDDKYNGVKNNDDTGWLLGVKFGHQKIGDFGTWQAKYNYRRLERDAWPDFLPDSDFHGGETNAEGHEVEFEFGLLKNLSMALDYYNTKLIDDVDGSDEQEDVFQADLNFKF